MEIDHKSMNIGTDIQELEDNYFIGRESELALVKDNINDINNSRKIINLYGTGGVGKTYSLNQVHQFAKRHNCLYFQLDSSDFLHNPLVLANHLLSQISFYVHSTEKIEEYSFQMCIQLLHELAIDQRIVISIDSYEKIGGLDNWFRNVFVCQLPQNSLIILAGRTKLSSEWQDSPAWREVITFIHLTDFTYEQTKSYLFQHDIFDRSQINHIWQFTKGHPLALSLATLTHDKTDWITTNNNILNKLSRIWLKEVNTNQLQEIIEAATVLRHFDQAVLSYVLDKEVSTTDFYELISLSFVKKTVNGWTFHDLIRDAIKIELKDRNLERFQQIELRCVSYYQKKLITNPTAQDISELFYYLGDELIQSAFFQDDIDNNLYLEEVEDHNFDELEAYFSRRKANLSENKTDFIHRESNQSYHFYVSLQHNKKESELIDSRYVKEMGYNVAKLLRDEKANAVGLSIVVPINKDTIKYLKKEPVSRTYFQQLSNEEYQSYAVHQPNNSGYFIRMLDCLNPTDHVARSFLLYNLFPLLLSGGRIITSTPLPFFQHLLQNFGFSEVPNNVHYDFGEQVPSPTYILDVRGERLIDYLVNFTKRIGEQNQMEIIFSTLHFTEREKDIVKLILKEQSNAEIAAQLYLAEVTVKKNISRILKKVNVKNRTQLIKRLMEIVYLSNLS